MKTMKMSRDEWLDLMTDATKYEQTRFNVARRFIESDESVTGVLKTAGLDKGIAVLDCLISQLDACHEKDDFDWDKYSSIPTIRESLVTVTNDIVGPISTRDLFTALMIADLWKDEIVDFEAAGFSDPQRMKEAVDSSVLSSPEDLREIIDDSVCRTIKDVMQEAIAEIEDRQKSNSSSTACCCCHRSQ